MILKNFFKNVTLYLSLIYLLFISLLIIAQLYFFDKIIIDYFWLRIVILFFDICYMFVLALENRKIYSIKNYTALIISMTINILFALLMGLNNFNNFFTPLAVIFNNLFFIFVIFTLSFDNTHTFRLNSVFNIIFIYAIINGVFSIFQFIKQDLILPNFTIDGNSIFKSVLYYGEFQRSCGFFFSALDVGILFCFASIFSLNYMKQSNNFLKKIMWFFSFFFFLFCIYTTKTRNVFLCMSLLLLYFFSSRFFKNKKIFNVSFVVFSIAVYFGIIWISGEVFSADNSLLSIKSLNFRLEFWMQWFQNIKNRNIIELIFGNCSSQATGLISDNMYLDYLSAFGVVGLCSFVLLFIFNCKRLSNDHRIYSRILLPFSIIIFSFGIFNLPITFFMIYLPLMVSILGKKDIYES